MSGLLADRPPRIFSPVGEFQAWDTLFKQQVPASMQFLLHNPNVPPMEKPKRPESFVIINENGPAGMSTPSAGSRENQYNEYRLQRRVHLDLKTWVKNTLNQDFRDACCPDDQTAFQWRENVVGRLREMMKEPVGAQATDRVADPSQKSRLNGSESDEPPSKRRKVGDEARSKREAELERRIASLTTEVRQMRKVMVDFQQKVTSLEDSGYASGSAGTKHTSQATSDSDESSLESGSDSEELEYTSSPPTVGPPLVAVRAISKPRPNANPSAVNRVVQQARSISGAANTRPRQATVLKAPNASARPVRVSSVPMPRPQQAPKLVRVTGGFPIDNEYSSSPTVLERGSAVRSTVSKAPVVAIKSEPTSSSNSEGSESSSDLSSSDEDSFESNSEDE